ncbi:dynamin family protein [Akkermansiaceae bacterium]|nr:dynamin family protein [Akkermansiaceae bacterium]MDB4333264.1 dynamin family protein [Akkermansiaceae bacterium]
MFGERYFATRQRLTDVVVGARKLGEKCGADVSALADEGEYLKGLRSPFLFVVCGEVNAGKSTLLNGLFGQNLCKTNILPETEKVHWYRWGDSVKNIDVTDTLQERYRPIEFLQDFNIVDTPGTNSMVRGHQAITERFLPIADVLLFVFPVSNPWGAATWDFISKLSKDNLASVAFVLQQVDLRQEKDVALIIEHVRSLSIQKIGASPEIFPVSGKMANEAKRTLPFSDRLWKKSGYPALESFISKRVADNPERRQVLSEVRDSTQVALRRIEEKVEQDTIQLDRDQAFLRELEGEVDGRRESQAVSFADKFSGLTEVFMNEARDSVDLLRKNISIPQSFLSLFRAERLPSEIEAGLVESVKDAVEERAGFDGKELVANCRSHWETVVPRIKKRLRVPIPDFDKETNSLLETRERFVRRLGRSSKQVVTNLKLRGNLDLQMEARRSVLRRFLSGALCAIIVAGILGALDLHPWPFLALGIALVFVAGAGVYAEKSKKELCKNFAERIEDCRDPFADALSSDYKDGVREFYLEYGGLFESVRRHIAEHKLSLKPRLERWNDLFLELKGIEQEI